MIIYNLKNLIAGISSGQFIEIKNGLASAEEMAYNAHYLVDICGCQKFNNGGLYSTETCEIERKTINHAINDYLYTLLQ